MPLSNLPSVHPAAPKDRAPVGERPSVLTGLPTGAGRPGSKSCEDPPPVHRLWPYGPGMPRHPITVSDQASVLPACGLTGPVCPDHKLPQRGNLSSVRPAEGRPGGKSCEDLAPVHRCWPYGPYDPNTGHPTGATCTRLMPRTQVTLTGRPVHGTPSNGRAPTSTLPLNNMPSVQPAAPITARP